MRYGKVWPHAGGCTAPGLAVGLGTEGLQTAWSMGLQPSAHMGIFCLSILSSA